MKEIRTKIDRFVVDANLLYAIQQCTNDSTPKILGFFNNLALNIATDHFSKKKEARRLDKTMKWCYPECNIPFSLNVFYSERLFAVHVKHSARMMMFDIDEILSLDADYSIGLEGALPVADIPPPKYKAPPAIKKMLKNGSDVVDTVEYTHNASEVDLGLLPEELKIKYGI
jgi:hypothetical protein